MFAEIMLQAAYYGVAMIMVLGFVGVIQKGFFWKYLKVRLSFGKKVIIKLRTPLIDRFAVGWVEDGQLVYKQKKTDKRKKITNRVSLAGETNFFYRCLAVNWIDVDEEKGSPCKTDYSAVTGHDLEKESNVAARALTRPAETSNQEKIMMLALIGIAIGIVVVGYLAYTNSALLQSINGNIGNLINNMAAPTVVATPTP